MCDPGVTSTRGRRRNAQDALRCRDFIAIVLPIRYRRTVFVISIDNSGSSGLDFAKFAQFCNGPSKIVPERLEENSGLNA